MEYVYAARMRRRRRQRIYRPRVSYDLLTEQQCRSLLRFSGEVLNDVCNIVHADLEANTNHPFALPVAAKVTVALLFYASGTFQRPLGLIGGISQSAISSAIHDVTSSLVRHASEFIHLPLSPEEQGRVKNEFWHKFRFPNVLGAIDCTHVQIRAPSDNALIYINRKGTYSINVQVICDAMCRITHVFANYPGSTHDSFILANSAIPAVFQRDPPLDGWLLGDNGFALRTWLMTPFIAPGTRGELAYNRKHTQARCVIERTFGLLKMRFRCLDKSGGILNYTPQKVAAFFVACCVLHNIAIRHGCALDLPEDRLEDYRRRAPRVPMPIDPPPAAARVFSTGQLSGPPLYGHLRLQDAVFHLKSLFTGLLAPSNRLED
ncbi:hypothetical protein WMY93_009235 [Mugilogobius chulae]|uniref:Putative nuclease HARBI1 n=1 Tax=Mugilogobius chulae TaxID=88201 RepID=A0AAW0PJX3_9GOBI